ncbi:autotransporter outer membrane beta-barrel domain-containing protein [Enterobacter sp. Ag1]|uniref:autotransporter outer membrane beta-barrel domain-containing protein n=1 Tax=Cedecea sp. USHLN005 TaxID=3081239 RepID=UPI000272ADB2|nr:outer membrane autotransporter [Enterobacter sp. Ag1]
MKYKIYIKWRLNPLLPQRLCILSVLAAGCSPAWAANNDTIIINGGNSTLSNTTLNNEVTGNFIVQARNNATVSASQLVLNSSGKNGGGAWIDNSEFNVQDLQVNVTGKGGSGVYFANDSLGTLDKFNITGQDNALGLVLDGYWTANQGTSVVQASNGAIATRGGDAIRVMAGELTLNNVSASTEGDHSYAVNANLAAKIAIEGGTFTTEGAYSDAVWVASRDSSVAVNNAKITTKGDNAIAVNAQRGEARMTRSTIETLGDNAHGLYSEYLITGDNLSVTTSGKGSVGMFTARGGQGSLTNSHILTSGELAPGLLAYPNAQIKADHVQIETTGKTSFGLWSQGGELDVRHSTIFTTGEDASGLYVNGSSSSTAISNTVTLENVGLNAAQARAIDVTATELLLNVKDSDISGGNGQLMSVQHYDDGASGVNNVYSKVTFNAASSALKGDIVVDDPANSVAVNLTSGSVLTGAVTHASSLMLDESSRWNINNRSVVGQLTNNGTLVFTDENNFDSLTVAGDYAGDGGQMVMNSVLGGDNSPANKLIVQGDVLPGTTHVSVNNLGGHGASTVEGIELVDVQGTSQGSFVKAGRIVAGAYDYDLVRKNDSWYLTSQLTPVDPEPTPEPDPEPTPGPDPAPTPEPKVDPIVRPEGGSYTANLAAANNLFIMTLHDRLGETQFIDALTGQREVTSLWLRQVGGHNVWRDGSGQLKTQSNRYLTQMGGDVARWSTDGTDRWHVGVMAGYGKNSSTTENRSSGYRSKGTVDGYSIGGYGTWYANEEDRTGAWLDSWLQYGWFNNEVKGDSLATEAYKSHGITASLEAGYAWKLGQFWGSQGTVNEWFVQPHAQAVWMGVRADKHQEENGTRVRQEGDGNVLTRLGVKTWLKSHHARDGHKQREFQPFVELNWLHNTRSFATTLDEVRIGQNGATNIAEAKVGLEGQISAQVNLWGNVGVQIGDAGYSDAAAMFGMKYNF